MKQIVGFSVLVLFFQACTTKEIMTHDSFVENEIRVIVSAVMPSDQAPETRVVLEGDSPSAPIVSKWQGSTSGFRDCFAIIGYDLDGNIAHVTDAVRLADETDDSISGSFEFSIDVDYWIKDLEYRSFYPLYPIKEYDLMYYSGSDSDKDNWVYKFSEQSGRFEDLSNYMFMTGPRINLDDPSIEFQYGVAILRLSNLCISDLKGHTVSNIKVKSNAIKDAVSYRYSFSNYSAANNEICITGKFATNKNGIIDNNIYVVFFPTTDTIEYLTISLNIDGKDYNYSYEGTLKQFVAGKVYTLKDAELIHKDKTPNYDWYINPVGENRYLISTPQDFLGFSKITNGDADALSAVGLGKADTFESKIVDIAENAEIDLSQVLDVGENWIPINLFKGTLNGNNATVSNLFINKAIEDSEARIGLFASIESSSIEALNVQGELNLNGSRNGDIGGLVAYAVNSIIKDCSTSVSLSYSSGYGYSIGGLLGFAQGCTIVECFDSSTIMDRSSGDTNYVGGIVGVCSYNYPRCTIVGSNHLTGDISNYGLSRLGGIVGHEGSEGTVIISCYNKGKITGTRAGQILGSCATGKGSPYITSCYYSGAGALYGVGIYNGSSNGYDYGTQRVENQQEMETACEDMNEKIIEWNTNNPSLQCNSRYSYENGGIVFHQ